MLLKMRRMTRTGGFRASDKNYSMSIIEIRLLASAKRAQEVIYGGNKKGSV